MSWIVIILIIIGIIIIKFFIDRDKMLTKQVDRRGGMLEKYKILVENFAGDPLAKIVEVRREHINISIRSPDGVSHTQFLIDETFDNVQIEWVAKLGFYGTFNKKWKFLHNFSQLSMIEEIKISIFNILEGIMFPYQFLTPSSKPVEQERTLKVMNASSSLKAITMFGGKTLAEVRAEFDLADEDVTIALTELACGREVKELSVIVDDVNYLIQFSSDAKADELISLKGCMSWVFREEFTIVKDQDGHPLVIPDADSATFGTNKPYMSFGMPR